MKALQQQWGYPVSSDTGGMEHETMGMANDMAAMSTSLHGLSGDSFDKAFILAMVDHHESAIAMSRPAAANAAHQPVKDLAAGLIQAQTAEVAQLRGWLSAWGYGDE